MHFHFVPLRTSREAYPVALSVPQLLYPFKIPTLPSEHSEVLLNVDGIV